MSLNDAKKLWEATQNTVGFNHAIGSASDPGMLVMETDAAHTAYFTAGDTTHEPTAIPEAAFRTNHGFDPETVAHYQWNGTDANNNSLARYDMLRGGIIGHAERGEKIGATEAVNLTAFLGQKNTSLEPAHYATCEGMYTNGSNVLSVAYQPAGSKIYAAWEDGSGDQWSPAACNGFVEVDLTKWW